MGVEVEAKNDNTEFTSEVADDKVVNLEKVDDSVKNSAKPKEGNKFTTPNNANELPAKKDASALESLSNTEVEKFLSQWNTSKVFRDDYERRILNSLNYRQLSRDGRMRNSDEKPIITATSQQAKVETPSNIVNPKQNATASITPPVSKEVVPDNITKTKESKKPTKSADKENAKSIEVEEIGLSLDAPKPEPVDPEKLK